MKQSLKLILLLMSGILCTDCSQNTDFTEKVYLYENEGFGGDFNIRINADGTFTYYEGSLSSYLGFGTWSVSGNTLVISDNEEFCGKIRINYFRISGNDLIFNEKNSDNFLYIEVSDGEKFHGIPLAELSETDLSNLSVYDYPEIKNQEK